MIETIADLLKTLVEIEKEEIDARGIKHTPTIGNMYEGLTAEILSRALPKEVRLNIVRNSFILKENGSRSAEMDVMLIEGEGKLIPYSQGQFDVNFEQV